MRKGGSRVVEADVRPDTLRGIARNAGALLLAYVLPRLLTFASVVLAARVLGTGDFGAYGTAAAFAVVLSILCSLGMLPLLVRDIARDPTASPRLLRAAHVVKTFSGAAMLAALLLLARVLAYPPEVTGAALLLGIGYWLASYGDNLTAYFQGVERMRVCTEASAAFGLVSGVLGALLVVQTRSVVWFTAAFAVGQAASLLWLLARAPADVRRGTPVGAAELVHLAREALPFAAAYVVLTVHYRVDVLVLERLWTPVEVGVYAAAYKFVDVFYSLVLVGVVAVFPRLSRAARREGAGANGRWAATRASELVLLVAVPAAGALWLLRAPAVFIFGDAYAGSVPVLTLLAPALPALALNLYGGYVLGAARRMGWVAGLYLGGVVVKVGLLFAAVPRWGAPGAAGAVLSAEVSLAVAFSLVLGRVVGAAPGWRPLALAAGAAGMAWGASATLAPAGAAWAAGAYLSGVVALYALGGAVSLGERRAIRGALAREPDALPAEGVP